MKNLLLLVLFFLPFSFAIGQNDCAQDDASCPGCCNYNKECSFNCHQYVRGCATGLVNLSTRVPNDDNALCALSSANIKSANDFIEVCYVYQSDAASMVNVDHSAYKVGSPFPYFATPNGSSEILCSGNATAGSCSTGSQSYENFAYIGDVEINGENNLIVGNTYTYTFSNLPAAVTIDYVYVNSTYATVVETNATSFKIKALAQISSLEIKVYYKTDCSGSAQRYGTETVSISNGGTNPCSGTLNGGPLYTFNYVSNSSNTVSMSSTFWTWQITSGYASYNTANHGQILNFYLSSGCVSFSAYRSGCGSRSFTFCKSSKKSKHLSAEAEVTRVDVFDIQSGRRVKTIECTPCDYSNEEITEELPFGIYVISRNGMVAKYAKLF